MCYSSNADVCVPDIKGFCDILLSKIYSPMFIIPWFSINSISFLNLKRVQKKCSVFPQRTNIWLNTTYKNIWNQISCWILIWNYSYFIHYSVIFFYLWKTWKIILSTIMSPNELWNQIVKFFFFNASFLLLFGSTFNLWINLEIYDTFSGSFLNQEQCIST